MLGLERYNIKIYLLAKKCIQPSAVNDFPIPRVQYETKTNWELKCVQSFCDGILSKCPTKQLKMF